MKNSIIPVSVLVIAALAILICASPAVGAQPQVASNAVVHSPTHFDVSPALREMAAKTPVAHGSMEFEADPALHPKLDLLKSIGEPRPVGAKRPIIGPLISATVGLSFQGTNNISGDPLNCPSKAGITVAPPDTNAAVGDTQVVEWANLCYVVFDKATGAVLAGPFAGNAFWSGFGGACQSENSGDPIIQWDKSNHVWVAAQNTFSGAFSTCVAISKTADATGAYNRYSFPQSAGFPDYPKWGLTPNVYYQSQNVFGSQFVGVNVCAYNGALMRKGSKRAKQICILDNSNGTLFDDSFLPADLDSPTGVAKGAGEVFLGSIDNFNPESHVYEYVYTVNFKGKGKATLSGVNGTMPINVPSFNLACGGFGACVQQPSGGEVLDSLGDRLMYRLATFNDGTNQHYLVTHSVDNTSATAARWYEFRAPTGSTNLTLFQSGETPDDGEYRWMGSVAYDKVGDIALGYSRTSKNSGDFASVYYSGQTAGDPIGTTESEAVIKQGGGVQQSTAHRWGDYSSMALDGADSCTFWYAQEFEASTGSFNWSTWLASLKFPNCH